MRSTELDARLARRLARGLPSEKIHSPSNRSLVALHAESLRPWPLTRRWTGIKPLSLFLPLTVACPLQTQTLSMAPAVRPHPLVPLYQAKFSIKATFAAHRA